MLAAALGLWLNACGAAAPQRVAAPPRVLFVRTASPAPRPRPPVVTASATPGAIAAPAGTASTAPAATTAPVRVPLQPRPRATPAGPQIYSVRATPSIVHGGDFVLWDVRTSPDIVSVVARTPLYALPLNKIAPGHFTLSFAIPSGAPWFFHGNYDLDVGASSSTGDTVHRQISLTFE